MNSNEDLDYQAEIKYLNRVISELKQPLLDEYAKAALTGLLICHRDDRDVRGFGKSMAKEAMMMAEHMISIRIGTIK